MEHSLYRFLLHPDQHLLTLESSDSRLGGLNLKAVLIFLSLVAKDVEHISKHLLAVSNSSFEIYLIC